MQEPDNSVAETEPSAGHLLRAAREGCGMSIEDVARQLRLSVRQITALEEEDYGKLPGGMFLRGFVRNYARLVQVDAAPILQLLQRSVPPDAPQTILPQAEKIPFPSNRERGRRNFLIIGVVVALTLPLLIYEIYRGGEDRQQPVQVESGTETGARQVAVPLQLPLPSATPSDSADGTNTAQAQEAAGAIQRKTDSPLPAQKVTAVARDSASPDAGKDVLHFMFVRESWVEVKDARGKTIFTQINPGGTEQRVYGKPPFSLIVGNAAGVRLVYNDRPVDLTPHTKVEVARLTLQ